MPEHLARHRQPRAHQHRRPDDAVKPRDVLADDVQVGRPPRLEQRLVGPVADRGRVVDQRVEPHVDDAVGVEGQRNAPRLARAADRDVLQAALQQPEDLVAANLGLQELRVRLEVREQRIAVLREAEEVVLLLDPLGRPLVHGAQPLDEVLLLLEGLAPDAVPALVVARVDVARRGARLHHSLHGRPVPRLGRPDEVVEGDRQARPHLAEHPLHVVAVRHRVLSEVARTTEHVLRVLVVAHEEPRIEAGQPLVTRDHVGCDLLVGRAEVRPAVDVVDGGREEESHLPDNGIARRCGSLGHGDRRRPSSRKL